MPQDCMNLDGRRRRRHHNTCKRNHVNGPIPGTCLGKGTADDCAAAAPRTSETTSVVTKGTKPQCVVNGYISYGYKGKSTKPAEKQGGRISAATDASAASGVSGGGSPCGVSHSGASRATTRDNIAFPHNSQVTPDLSLSTAVKSRRRWKKFSRKKRDTEVICMKNSQSVLIPKHKEEDWENETQEVTLTDWQRMCFGLEPYGPEDVLHFALRDLTLKQSDMVDLPVTANYSPAEDHPQPVHWLCYSIPTEPDQFADV